MSQWSVLSIVLLPQEAKASHCRGARRYIEAKLGGSENAAKSPSSVERAPHGASLPGVALGEGAAAPAAAATFPAMVAFVMSPEAPGRAENSVQEPGVVGDSSAMSTAQVAEAFEPSGWRQRLKMIYIE